MRKLIVIAATLLLLPFIAGRPPGSILISTGWETGTGIADGVYPLASLCGSVTGAAVSDSFAREGTHSARFELNATDPDCAGNKRIELYLQQSNALSKVIQWYAYSEYIPAWLPYNPLCVIHFQIHHAGSIGSPPVAIWNEGGRWTLQQYYDPTNSGKQISKSTDLGPVVKGQWIDWVIYYKWRLDPTGQISVWKNGVQVANVPGVNFNMVAGGVPEANPYLKFGIYGWPWRTGGPYTPSKDVVYIDRYMMGDSTATLADFTPAAPPTPLPPALDSTVVKGPWIIRKN